MSEKLGIENLKPLVMLACEAGNVADKMGRSKGMARYMNLTSLTDELMGLGSVDFAQVKAEVKDLDSAERLELENAVKSKFDIVDDALEGLIEDSLSVLEDLYSGVEKALALAKKFKSE